MLLTQGLRTGCTAVAQLKLPRMRRRTEAVCQVPGQPTRLRRLSLYHRVFIPWIWLCAVSPVKRCSQPRLCFSVLLKTSDDKMSPNSTQQCCTFTDHVLPSVEACDSNLFLPEPCYLHGHACLFSLLATGSKHSLFIILSL